MIDSECDSSKPVLSLSGKDGNAYAILGEARKVARINNIDFNPILEEATSGDYNNLLQTMRKYFDVF
jgi:hypothetical protein